MYSQTREAEMQLRVRNKGYLLSAMKLIRIYSKHLDSHLKPYRCKVLSCVTPSFSSTACLLRHEREAHGMHGHGDKPYLCNFDNCDRSIPGNGFPRRWNLRDHMRRVHDYTGSPSNESTSPSPSSMSTQSLGKGSETIRKRRTCAHSQSQPMKRNKSATTARQFANPLGSHTHSQEAKQRQVIERWHKQTADLRELQMHYPFLQDL